MPIEHVFSKVTDKSGLIHFIVFFFFWVPYKLLFCQVLDLLIAGLSILSCYFLFIPPCCNRSQFVHSYLNMYTHRGFFSGFRMKESLKDREGSSPTESLLDDQDCVSR